MFEYCVYLFYRGGIWLLNLTPVPLLFALGRLMGGLAWIFLPQYRQLARHNVRIAFDSELTTNEQKRLVRRHFQRLGANFLCSIKLAQMPMAKILERVQVKDFRHIEECLAAKKPLILLLSHIGPWEVCAQLLPHFIPKQRKSTVYQRLRNRFIEEHVREVRGRFGIEMFDRSAGFGKAIELLRRGGAIGVLSDQHAGDGGLWTPFFGRIASTTPLPALLAKRTGGKLVALAIYTKGTARWEATAEAPLSADDASVEAITAAGNALIEQQVRRAPEDWFWVHNRWKTPRPNFLLGRYKRGVFVPAGTKLKPFRILVRSSNWLGDAVMSVPAVRAIKNGRPDAHLTIVTPEKIAALWKTISEVDEVMALSSKSILQTVRRLRMRPPFDAALLFPNSLRSALEVWLAGVPRRVGSAGHHRHWLLNQQPRRSIRRGIVHQTYLYLELASTIGARVRADFPAAKPVQKNGAQTRFGLCPGAEYGPAKRWLPERFIEVAQNISDKTGAHWILFGTAADAAVADEIAAALGDRCNNRAGQTTLEQLITELQSCDLLLTNDTGTMHLAALLNVPTVSIFGSTEPLRTGPLGAGHRILRHHVECSPCFLRECPLDFRCMRAISSAEVIAAICEMVVSSSSQEL